MAELQKTCIHKALQVVGDKWSPLILREISLGNNRFSSLEKSFSDHSPCISPRTLSQRLDALEREAILEKKAYHELPPRIEYTLTKKGRDLMPILEQMAKWGTNY